MNIFITTVSLDPKKLTEEEIKKNPKVQENLYVRADSLESALKKSEKYISKSEKYVEILQLQKGIEITID